MITSLKVLYNTLSLYGKMIVTTIVSLYVTRLVLNYLGVSDFGLYSLIGGVVSLLSFVNSALMVSTQRYLSVALGEKNICKIKRIFSSSILIHGILTIILIFIFELCVLFLFDGFLNIAKDRVEVAKIVYQLMVISTVFTVLGVPYNAIINAKEDLWLFSIVETVCAILKIGIILIFQYINRDALILYSSWMLIITIINFALKYIWCKVKYDECNNLNVIQKDNISLVKEMIGFSAWNAFGTLALIGRNQGVAVILNIFWSTSINAVYGIANQLNSQLIYFSTMMTTSMTPQIMKSYGEGNLSRMLNLSLLTCKLSFFLSAVFAIPLLIEMPFVLTLWLKTVPQSTEIFCSLIIFMFLVMQLYPGLNRAIQARGRIKWYQILTSVILLLPIPLGLLFNHIGYESYFIIYAMIISQIIQMLVAVFMAKRLVGLNIIQFFLFSMKAIISFIIIYCCGYYIHQTISMSCNEVSTFMIVLSSTMVLFTLLYYFLVFDMDDRRKINNLVQTIISKLAKRKIIVNEG